MSLSEGLMSGGFIRGCGFLMLGLFVEVTAHADPVNTYFQLGVSAADFGYQEFDEQNVLLDREDGAIPGMMLEFGIDQGSVSAALRFELADGLVVYDGQTQSGTPIKTETDEKITNLQAVLRYKLKPLSQYDVMLIGGVGQRVWRRDIRATNITSSLLEVYRWQYWMLGASAPLWKSGQWSAGIDVRWLRPIQPTMSVHLVGYDDIQLDLRSRDSARIGFPIRIAAQKEWILTPYWEWWQLGRSMDKALTVNGVPTATTVHEPRSDTRIVGITFSVQL
ncbi:MAG: hypothetical protein RRB22_03985 [Gammaproteobacteria bacterium]|nr:hypothetical protein [Gammaproteobacteria bacterium]